MAEDIDFENRRISNFKGLVTLDWVIRHTVVHHSSTCTYIPNFIGIGKTFCGRTYVRTDEHETHIIRSTLRSRPKKKQCSFCLESVGGWRKDEFQWISLALVGDIGKASCPDAFPMSPTNAKDIHWNSSFLIRPQKLRTSCPLWMCNVLSFHSSAFIPDPSAVWEGHGGMVLKRSGTVRGPDDPGLPGTMARRVCERCNT